MSKQRVLGWWFPALRILRPQYAQEGRSRAPPLRPPDATDRVVLSHDHPDGPRGARLVGYRFEVVERLGVGRQFRATSATLASAWGCVASGCGSEAQLERRRASALPKAVQTPSRRLVNFNPIASQ
ncbi:MAG: hypothetical protein ABGY41_17005, partial [Candidatus Poribacteria bacterium]